jgi:ferritin-like metal-binding protein YciE
MPDHTINDAIKRYLKDAIAAENSFETQLRGFANEGDDEQVRALFRQHAEETRGQITRLTSRLNVLGDSPSTVKSFMAHLFGMAPKTASLGHDEAERVTQNLMMAYTVEHAEIAMYESLATVAEAAGDRQTALLAREIQQEEEATARKVWSLIAVAARQSTAKLASEMTR